MMEYKGYVTGRIEFDRERGVFSATVAGLQEVIHFEADDARSLVKEFHDSIDDYLKRCQEQGREPERAREDFLKSLRSLHARLPDHFQFAREE